MTAKNIRSNMDFHLCGQTMEQLAKKGQMFCHIEAKFYILFKFTPIIVDDDLNVPNTKQGTFSNDFLLLYNSEILL